jgi:penicillin-binding protein 1A
MLCAAEDERCFDRLVSIDPVAYVRAAVATARAKLFHAPHAQVQGASDISAQLARLLLGIHASGGGWDAVRAKLEKTLAAWRIDDLLSRRQQLQLYLATAPFGSLAGHEAVGLESAARVFYGKTTAALDAAELAELMAHLRNPNLYFPYRKSGESEEHFQARLAMLHVRADAILDVAARKGWIMTVQRDEARARLFLTLLPLDYAAENIRLPHAASVLGAVAAHVPDAARRHLAVTVELNEQLQSALAAATAEAEAAVHARLRGHLRRGDTLTTDVIVIRENGAVAALAGLASVSGGMASNLKPEFYALWLELDAGRSMGQRLHGLHITAAEALTRSYNPGAEEVAREIGLGRVVAHLRSQGYSVLGPFEPIVLGAGVTGSPWLVVGNFVKFGYSTPGYRVQPSLVARISDAATGAVLFEPEKERVFTARAAVEVRASLENVGTVGTARGALHALASASPVAAKTGTAGFFRRGHWQGEGGSWCVAADEATGLVMAVRMRWVSGAPLEIEGGKSAALVVAKFLDRARSIRVGGDTR